MTAATSRRTRTILLGSVLVVVIIVCVWLATRSTRATPDIPPPLDPVQVIKFQTALVSDDPGTVEAVLAPAVRTAYQAHPFRMLPAGSQLVVDAGSFTADGSGATVTATVTRNGAAQRWVLLLAAVDDQWLVYGTARA